MSKAVSFIRPTKTTIGIVGLGYVGLPLLIELSKKYSVIGYDVDEIRVRQLKNKVDRNGEIKAEQIFSSTALFTSCDQDLAQCNFIIVTVPTPINHLNKPDLQCLEKAMTTISQHLKRGDVIVLESTVYPGVTEHVCGEMLQRISKMVCNYDFFMGYSPERVNPGDNINTVSTITKIVSAQNSEVLDYMAEIYGAINNGRIFKAKNIKTAEAAKVIENAQRDINIAFINEITKILNKENIRINDVLDAAKTKWNFLDFKPGLVGGHCISVDPYYLSFYSENLGITPHVISAGRLTNDGMSNYVATYLERNLRNSNKEAKKILLLGFTFKENVNDVRNTKVHSLYTSLKAMGFEVDIHDPLVTDQHLHEYPDLVICGSPSVDKYDLVALCVPHQTFIDNRDFYLSSYLHHDGMIFDLKGAWNSDESDQALNYKYLTL